MPSPKKHDSSTKAEASQQGPRKLSNTNKRASTHADGRAVAQNFVVADSSINEETKISTRYKATAKADVSFRESAYNLSKRPVEGQHGAANGVLISSSTMCAEIRPSPPTSNSTTENETTDPSTTSKPAKLPPAPTPPAHYVPPVKRYRLLRAEQAADREIVTAVEQMQDFIRVNDVNQPTVRARLQGRESLQKLQQAFRDNYDRDYSEVEQLLVTATIFGCTVKSPGIPPDEAIVTITNPIKAGLLWAKRASSTPGWRA
ncbi:hypothetical protein L915_15575 [Phytophthora nicotianae]|uniref:Uncharacterized protein n=1 Tax=Phytophthora nicotianae TaxID=4792 RepID=W2G5S1_PHYNI|nr:hypothetical protein L915_15575 [Phytophthora nicotianae]